MVTHLSGIKCKPCDKNGPWESGGETGIRTLETIPRLHTFQACAFDHSATSPRCLTAKTIPWQAARTIVMSGRCASLGITRFHFCVKWRF